MKPISSVPRCGYLQEEEREIRGETGFHGEEKETKQELPYSVRKMCVEKVFILPITLGTYMSPPFTLQSQVNSP